MTFMKNDNDGFDWKPQPAAAQRVKSVVDDFLQGFDAAGTLAEQMSKVVGTRFGDWIDTIILPYSRTSQREWESVGFEQVEEEGFDGASGVALRHPHGLFPSVVLWSKPKTVVMVKVESVVDFLVAHGLDDRVVIKGSPTNRFRFAEASVDGDSSRAIWVAERHGYRGYSAEPVLMDFSAADPIAVLDCAERFALRRRAFETSHEGYAHLHGLIGEAVKCVGADRACDLFFAAERGYWQSRNRAAQIQKARQDRLGLGWANHDHHTYRSSRGCFGALIGTLEMLGFSRREKFYAGAEAGWGAQVMEQAQTGITVFADVDMSAEEVTGDFSDGRLTEPDRLGTVGLWCALHGEAMLEAGMHHLECQFDFVLVREQLASEFGVGMMKPFTDFAFLKQAFTEGQVWPVKPERLARLVERGAITKEQADTFAKAGALGSHLESLQRDDGFKGFNQTGINQIIAATDPRRSQVR